MTHSQSTLFPTQFDQNFLDDHAGRIVKDPKIAIVELVANAFDAGATRVEITWPESLTKLGKVAISDNGCGMSREHFAECWSRINYDRRRRHGDTINWPRSVPIDLRRRKAYGRNGKGRHAMFCFANTYNLATATDTGESNQFTISRSDGADAFSIVDSNSHQRSSHGTYIWANFTKATNYINVDTVRSLIGSKFAADPAFEIFVNGQVVALDDLQGSIETETIHVPEVGDLVIHLLDSGTAGRTSRQHGVAWWVNHRLVGEASWRGYDTIWLDARSGEGKRYTFIVKADPLEKDVRDDWSEFQDTENYHKSFIQVRDYILQRINRLFHGNRQEKKRQALADNVDVLSKLTKPERAEIGRFVNDLTVKCPTIGNKELSVTVELLAKLEKTRNAYSLLNRLAQLNPDDLDTLDTILKEWSVRDAQTVLSILRGRLLLIDELERRMDDPATDELQELQPLFGKGLWIFGPEYESVEFASNRQLLTVVRDYLHVEDPKLTTPRRRPDFIVMPNSSIGIYARNGFNIHGEYEDIAKIFILELKRGGFTVGRTEKQQGANYASEIRNSGKITMNAEILVTVLGSKVDSSANRNSTEDDQRTIIRARSYTSVLDEAKARTLNLSNKIENIHREEFEKSSDPDVEQVIASTLFNTEFSTAAYEAVPVSKN